MREILFRGKTLTNKGWVYGLLTDIGIDEKESVAFVSGIMVHKSTVGQYTGLTDKNGKMIFEGDIVKNDWCFIYGYSVVKFGQYKSADMSKQYQQGHLGFYLEHIHEVDKKTVRQDMMYFANKCEVIGNIHDNPELLKDGAE